MTFKTLPQHTVQHGERITVVQRDAALNEYRVRLSTYGTVQPDADYFTDDLDDAIGTGKSMVRALPVTNAPLAALRHHVSGAIARGESEPVVEKKALILNKGQAEAVYRAMVALNNVTVTDGIKIAFNGNVGHALHRIFVEETDRDVIRVSVLNHNSSAEYHAGQAAFATAYGLE